MAQKSQWEQYLQLLERLRFGNDRIKQWERLYVNAQGIASRIMQDFPADLHAYPAVQRTKFRSPC